MGIDKALVWIIICAIPVLSFILTYMALPQGTSLIIVARYFTYVFTCSNIVIMLMELCCVFGGLYFFHKVLVEDVGGGYTFFGSVLWVIASFMPLFLLYSGDIKSCWQ